MLISLTASDPYTALSRNRFTISAGVTWVLPDHLLNLDGQGCGHVGNYLSDCVSAYLHSWIHTSVERYSSYIGILQISCLLYNRVVLKKVRRCVSID